MTPLGGENYRGEFDRSEMLGQLIVPDDEDLESVEKPHGDSIRATLRDSGVNVVL